MNSEISCRQISRRPYRIQKNCVPIDMGSESLVRSKGIHCEFDDRLRRAFNSTVRQNSVRSSLGKGIILAFGAFSIGSGTLALLIALITAFTAEDTSKAAIVVPVVLGVIFIAAGIGLLIYSGKVKDYSSLCSQAEMLCDSAECFRFKFKLLRYTYWRNESDPESEVTEIYADLGELAVEIFNFSDKWERAEYAYAALIDVNGTHMFFFFNDEEQ
ncbi:MAG: hypothetical protein J5999_00210 [Oscillospiraceae bacterium]|nr:hypothetical protein [Oscillospiraceae bacterium]